MSNNANSDDGALDVKRLGQHLAHLRKAHGLTLTELGERAQVAKSYIHSLERGEAENPGLRTLDALARALGVTVGDFLDAMGQPPSEGGALLRSVAAEADQLLADAPEELRTFLVEVEEKEGPVPMDVLRSLATLQLRGKRPRTLDDWRFAYESLKRAVR